MKPETEPEESKKKYEYDPHLDPQLVWAGKAEHTSFEVPTVSLHVHERIDPKTVLEAVRKRNGEPGPEQLSMFARPEEQQPLREALDFYKHAHGWSNRLVAGDSLLVMNSLLEKEGMAGKVQMIYIDPPYGIRYGSNFQPFVNRRDVKDGKDEDLTQEPEMIRAFRDTWELGIHSYLAYLRDRLLLGRELLHESGSIFLQIGPENVHRVRAVLDEIFGSGNACTMIVANTTSGFGGGGRLLSDVHTHILWYAKNRGLADDKYHAIYLARDERSPDTSLLPYNRIELANGDRRRMTSEELENPSLLPTSARRYRIDNVPPSDSDRTQRCSLSLRAKYIIQAPIDAGVRQLRECSNWLVLGALSRSVIRWALCALLPICPEEISITCGRTWGARGSERRSGTWSKRSQS